MNAVREHRSGRVDAGRCIYGRRAPKWAFGGLPRIWLSCTCFCQAGASAVQDERAFVSQSLAVLVVHLRNAFMPRITMRMCECCLGMVCTVKSASQHNKEARAQAAVLTIHA